MKILVTGGAGYLGCVLVPELCKLGHEVVVYDSLLFDGKGLLGCFRDPNFSFIKGDVRDSDHLRQAVDTSDVIVHLAAIVGYPACERDPELAIEVNVEATKSLAEMVTTEQYVVFSSTCSNYGVVVDGICTEETPLRPQTVYGKTKTEAEKILLNECRAIACRFATAFGLSPRLRLDLLVNDFVYKALKDKYLVVYESHFMRSFIHVYDMARAIIFALENQEKMVGGAYNVGDEDMNYSKKEVCELIAKRVEFYLHIADFGKDSDVRNYTVSYDKIASLGYRTSISLDTGIDELVAGIQAIKTANPYSNVNGY